MVIIVDMHIVMAIVIGVVVREHMHRYSRLEIERSLMPTSLVQVQWMVTTYALCQ